MLVVDDETRISNVLNRSLSTLGHTVYEAEDGQVALDQLESRDVDLVLLDLVMPRRGGFEVLGVLKERASSPPVIVLTAVTTFNARIQALDRGAVDVVAKPFSTVELAARVRRQLHEDASPSAGGRRYMQAGGIQLDLQGVEVGHPAPASGGHRLWAGEPDSARVRPSGPPDAAQE